MKTSLLPLLVVSHLTPSTVSVRLKIKCWQEPRGDRVKPSSAPSHFSPAIPKRKCLQVNFAFLKVSTQLCRIWGFFSGVVCQSWSWFLNLPDIRSLFWDYSRIRPAYPFPVQSGGDGSCSGLLFLPPPSVFYFLSRVFLQLLAVTHSALAEGRWVEGRRSCGAAVGHGASARRSGRRVPAGSALLW